MAWAGERGANDMILVEACGDLQRLAKRKGGRGPPNRLKMGIYYPPSEFFPANGPSPFVQVHGSLRVTPALKAEDSLLDG